MNSLRDWNKGDHNRDRSHLQEPVDAIRQLQNTTAAPAGGDADTVPAPVELGLAKIVDKGPDGDADFTDARYWLNRQLILAGDFDDPVKVDDDTTDQISYQSPPYIFPATNWPERQKGSHGLLTDGTIEVMYFAFYDAGSPQQKHYVFYTEPDLNFFVKVTGPTTNTDFTSIGIDGGVYDGVYSKDAVGLTLSPPSCVIVVTEEAIPSSGTQTHWTKPAAQGIARFSGANTTDNLPIMRASGLFVDTTVVATIPNAATQRWGRQLNYLPATTDCGDCACTLQFPQRSGLFRTLIWDKRGQLISVSEEHA